MTIQLEMTKRVESLQLVLEKCNVKQIKPCQVKLAMDVSSSFDDEHRNGYTQLLLDRFVPFSLIFDKDKELDVVSFSNGAKRLESLTEYNYQYYIKNVVMNDSNYGGGTMYMPPMKLLLEGKTPTESIKGFFSKLFKSKDTPENKDRDIIFFITDGEAFDSNEFIGYMDNNVTDSNFVVFVSIGKNINTFSKYTNKKNTHYFNISIAELRSLRNMTDEQMYNLIITDKMVEWFNRG